MQPAGGAAGYSVHYGYDLQGLQAYARFGSPSGPGITNSFDALGRLVSSTTNMDGTSRTINSHYDTGSRRTAITGDAGYHAGFSYDGAGNLTAYAEGGTNTVVQLGYDSSGQRSSLTTTGSSVSYGYDPLLLNRRTK